MNNDSGRDPLGRLMYPSIQREPRWMDWMVYGGAILCVAGLIGVVAYTLIA